MTILTKLLVITAAILGTIGIAIGLSALLALPVYWLWNGLLPKIFGMTRVTFLQAWGISILAALFFKPLNISSK